MMKSLLMILSLLFVIPQVFAAQPWQHTVNEAKGQTVYFYAWGGNPQINRYLQWVRQQLQQKSGIDLVHVKVADVSEAITLLLADKAAGRDHHGKVDLLWVNGKNFAALKQADLLHGPFVRTIPNFANVDSSLPIDVDFSIPVDGLEAPWGVGQMVMMFDQSVTATPPGSAAELLAYATKHPGRITYPQPPQFHGMTFIKQLLSELVVSPHLLGKPVDKVDFEKVTEPLWQYLDRLHQVAWYQGRRFPQSDRHMMQLLDDRELHMALSFNPAEAAAAVTRGDLEPTVTTHAFADGALTNIHYLAIPGNAHAKAGAKVAINFLLSTQAQQHKADLAIWGDPPVLKGELMDVDLNATARFASIPEPHYSWQSALERAWLTRYGYQ